MEDDKIREIVAEIRNALGPVVIALDMPNDEEGLADAKTSMDRVVRLLKDLVGQPK